MTVISPLQQRTLLGAAKTLGHALQVGENWKMTAHADASQAAMVSFISILVETLGRW